MKSATPTYLEELTERFALSRNAAKALKKLLPPPGYTRSACRWGPDFICFKCQIQLPAKAFHTDTDVICKTCLASVIDSCRAAIKRDAETGLSNTISRLADRDVPANPRGVARALKKLDARDTSVPEMVLDLVDELQGFGLSEDEKIGRPRFFGHEKDLLKLLADLVNKRDESLFGQNPYQDVTPRDLLGSVIASLIDEMLADRDYSEFVVKALINRVPHFVQLVHQLSPVSLMDSIAESSS